MTNVEFQNIVIGSLRELREGQKALMDRQMALEGRQSALEDRQSALEDRQSALENRQVALEEGQKTLEHRQIALEAGQKDTHRLLQAILDETADLTEFRTETNEKLDLLLEENHTIKEIVGRHEVDIRIMQRKIERRIV